MIEEHFKKFTHQLSQRLKGELPGFEAQKRMGPKLADGRLSHDQKPPDNCRKNAVMLLFYPDGDEIKLILTVRSEKLPSHKGEISCPGGGIESQETVIEAALRETEEETGVDSEKIDVIGMLSDLYIPVSNNVLSPVVGVLWEKPELIPNPAEVTEILIPSLHQLTNEKNIKIEDWEIRGFKLTVPFWDIFPIPLWGATAMILSELITILKETDFG